MHWVCTELLQPMPSKSQFYPVAPNVNSNSNSNTLEFSPLFASTQNPWHGQLRPAMLPNAGGSHVIRKWKIRISSKFNMQIIYHVLICTFYLKFTQNHLELLFQQSRRHLYCLSSRGGLVWDTMHVSVLTLVLAWLIFSRAFDPFSTTCWSWVSESILQAVCFHVFLKIRFGV